MLSTLTLSEATFPAGAGASMESSTEEISTTVASLTTACSLRAFASRSAFEAAATSRSALDAFAARWRLSNPARPEPRRWRKARCSRSLELHPLVPSSALVAARPLNLEHSYPFSLGTSS